MKPFERHVIGVLVSACIALPAAAHTGSDGGAHHGVLNEIVHGLTHLDPLLAAGLCIAAAAGVLAFVRMLRRKA